MTVSATSSEMAALIAAKDWSRTSPGPAETWSPALRTILDVTLANRFPVVFWWGPEFIQFYNDPYRTILGAKHPESLGASARDTWSEIWDVIGPQMESVYAGGPSTWNEDLPLDINRHGFVEETYFTFSYSTIPDPSVPHGIGGVLGTVQETSEKVIGERRMQLLRDLAARSSEARSIEDECRVAAETLGRYPKSIPFSLIYLLDEHQRAARLIASSGGVLDTPAAPEEVSITDGECTPWPLHLALQSNDVVFLEQLNLAGKGIPPGPWPEPPRSAAIVPIQSNLSNGIAGFLVGGINPRARFDDRLRDFFALVGSQIATAIINAGAYEQERKRAEALAEIDRAKTSFFTNVSHEFRTPLTLMLGPLDELSTIEHERYRALAETARRNSLRLLKLVNTLLEFSRLEAGRNDASFSRTDLAALTRDLAGGFRSAIESAGLRFAVEIELDEPVFVDRSMWERIALNLLSNALKFTLEGQISVTLRRAGDAAEFIVEDTGSGIAPEELPHVFERFHRVRGAKSRTYEGSGIGLALVQDLVLLHGGSVEVQSETGRGSVFRVRIPLGHAHLEPSKIAWEPDAAAYTSALSQYLADVDATIARSSSALQALPSTGTGHKRILLADDNGDLREYVARILTPWYDVAAVANGAEALQQARTESFDLIISDVMMPEMDGFELLRAIRNDERLAATPFIMLSARAGEEAAIEGLSSGADDYLAKPFSSEELLARVYAHLNAAAIRERAMKELQASEERFRTLTASMPHMVIESDPRGQTTFLSEAFTTYTGLPVESGHGSGWMKAVHTDDAESIAQKWSAAVESGEPLVADVRLRRSDGDYRWHFMRMLPQRNEGGSIIRWTGTATDIHDLWRAAQERNILAEAGRVLAQSLDLETTLQGIARIAVPRFGDWAQIDLRTEDGGIRTVAIAHSVPEQNQIAQQFVGRVHLNAEADAGSPYVIRTGRSQVIADVTPRVAEEAIGDPDEYRMYRQLGLRSTAAVPITDDEGKTLGMLAVIYGHSGRRYSDEDLPILEELGRRAGVAIQKARLFEREHRVAESLQEASLPPALPKVPGFSFDAVYAAGSTEAQIGGDWYDAVRLIDGRLVISIGDVAGSGLQAAVIMANMRQIIRGIAQVHADPALMLDAADRALRLDHPDRFVTAFVAVLDPIDRTFAYASAGHPPAMIRRPDGAIEVLSDGGLPLGLRGHHHESHNKVTTITDGTTILLYTDGITEFDRDALAGERRLRDALADDAVRCVSHPARALKDAVLSGETARDDVALLVVDVKRMASGAAAKNERWRFDALDAARAGEVRLEFRDGLRQRGISQTDAASAELVLGELLGNVVRYAPGEVEVIIDWSGDAPVLHVLDSGPGFRHIAMLPRDIFSESGRGLYIVSSLTQDFHVSRRASGGSHARAVLSVRGQELEPIEARTYDTLIGSLSSYG